MLALKALAAGAVVLAGAALGARRAGFLSARRMALQDALLLLQLARARLEGGGPWLCRLQQAAAEADLQVLRFPAQWPEGPTLADTLQGALEAAGAQRLLGQPAGGWLHAALLCAPTREETAARLEYYDGLLRAQLEQACHREQVDRALWLRLGWMGGLLLAVILW